MKACTSRVHNDTPWLRCILGSIGRRAICRPTLPIICNNRGDNREAVCVCLRRMQRPSIEGIHKVCWNFGLDVTLIWELLLGQRGIFPSNGWVFVYISISSYSFFRRWKLCNHVNHLLLLLHIVITYQIQLGGIHEYSDLWHNIIEIVGGYGMKSSTSSS